MRFTMSRLVVSGALALAALGGVAVLDVGSSTAEAAPSASPFAGTWSGTWTVVEDGFTGTYDWTISDAGRITGTIYGITSGRSGTVVGHVGDDGDLVLTRYTPNDEPSSGYGAFLFQGTAVIDDDGKLVATVTGTGQGALTHVAILEKN